jgi:hypothetical protein
MQVFISYSSRDRVEALKVKALVDELGHDGWMDVFDIRAGSALSAELEQKVKASGALLLLLSPFAVESPWVTDEIVHAREAQAKGLLFVPIMLRPTRLPDALGDLRAIDATRARGLEEDSFRLDLERALGGEIDEALILNAETRAALADRVLVDEAEAAFPGIKEDMRGLLDQPIRNLDLVIDQRMWPTPDCSMLQIQLRVDIFKGDASIFLAPYREGRTWSENSGFDERPPDEFFGQPKPRIDARFSFLGRSFELRPVIDGTDLGELPIEFRVELDGSEFTGEERASTMLLAERFELPSIRDLIEKRSEVVLWRHEPGNPAVAVDPHTIDIEMRLYATFHTTGVSRSLRLWSSRRSREEIVLERCQTLTECESPIESEILLDAFYPRPLRESENARSRRERIGTALDHDEPIPEDDGWAAFRMMRGASDILAFRGQYQQSVQELHKAISHLPDDLALDRDPYGAIFEYWNAVMRLAALLDRATDSDDALRFYTGEAVRAAEEAVQRDPQEPDFRRAVARALIHRVRLFQRRFGTADVQDLERAEQIMDALAGESHLSWRVQEAEQTRMQSAELRAALGAPTAEATTSPPLAFARWLDPRARADERKLLQISALLRYSAFVSERLPWSTPELHLIDKELVQLFRSDSQPGWFCVSIAETGSDDPNPATRETVLQRAPLALTMGADCAVLKWEPTEELGDLVERLELEQAHAVRALVRENDVTLRMYLLEARTRLLRWTVALVLPSQGDDWKDVARDDASAAITFSRLCLS